MDRETMFITWLAFMIVPILLYGIWMRIKMMGSDEGTQFLIDRELANRNFTRTTTQSNNGQAEMLGKVAKLGVGMEALDGKYGDEVNSMLKTSFKVFGAWLIYLLIIGPLGYFFIV